MNEYVTIAVTPEYEVGFNTAWDRLRLTTYDEWYEDDVGEERAGEIEVETWLSSDEARALAAALIDAADRFDGLRR